MDHFSFVQGKVLLIRLETDAQLLVFAELNHTTFGEIIHHIFKDRVKILIILKSIELYVIILNDLNIFGSPFARYEASAPDAMVLLPYLSIFILIILKPEE